VIAMLRQPEGATVDEVASVTGWQRHTVRGVFSGTLKKKLGLTPASVFRVGRLARRCAVVASCVLLAGAADAGRGAARPGSP